MAEYTKDQLLEIFHSNGIDVLDRRTGDVSIDCPFCGNQKKKLWVKGNIWHCFRCEERGGVNQLFQQLNIKPGQVSLSTEDLKNKVLRANRAIQIGAGFGNQRLVPKLEAMNFPPGFRELRKDNKSRACQIAYRLLRSRGLGWKDCRRWNIGYDESGQYLQHLIFPVTDEHSKNITFQARRFIGNFDPKTKNPFDDGTTYSKTDALYGIQWMKKRDPVVLVEGPFDAIYLDKVFRLLDMRMKAIALLGHAISPVQIMYLASFEPSAVFVMFDSDVQRECRETGGELANWYKCPVYITELEYGDPDDLTPEELLIKIKNSYLAKPRITKSRKGRFGARSMD